MKKSKIGILIGVILLLVGSGAGAFYVWNSMQDSYSSKYTLEEVNQKIMSSQKKLADQLEKTLNDKNMLADSQRITGDIQYGGNLTSPLGGGKGLIKLEGLDIQQLKDNLDISLDTLSLSGSLNMMGQKMDAIFSVGDSHLISNASGSYIKVQDIVQKFSSLPGEVIPREWTMTLNRLASDDKYIDLGSNLMYSMVKEQYANQNSQGEEIQKLMIDLLKNEPIFVAYSQEETKYHLTLSESMCKIKKMEKIPTDQDEENGDITLPNGLIMSHNIYQRNELEVPSYQEFVSNYESCNKQEYNDFKELLTASDFHEIHALYVELSDKKLHLAADYSFHVPQDDTQSKLSVHGKYDGVFELMKATQTTMSLNIESKDITGSGVLIEYKDETLSGFLDIDMPKYNFDSNLSLSGAQDKLNITGDYSLEIDQDMLDSINAADEIRNINISGKILTENMQDSGSIEITHLFSTQGEIEVSGDLEIKSDYQHNQTTQSGSTIIKGTVSMGDQATPIYGDAKIMWNMSEVDSLYTGENSIMFNAPNIASGEYFMNYSIDNSKAIEADFKNPESIVTEKSLYMLLSINERKAEKLRQQERLKKIHAYKTDPSVFHEYTVNAINSKLHSDLRSFTTAVKTSLLKGDQTLSELISVKETIELDNGAILYIGSPNLETLEFSYFVDLYNLKNLYGEDYDMRVLVDEANDKSYYQVGGPILTQDENDYSIRGNYIKEDSEDPESLFDIEKK